MGIWTSFISTLHSISLPSTWIFMEFSSMDANSENQTWPTTVTKVA